MRRILSLTIALMMLVILSPSYAQAADGHWRGRFPHGNYCEGSEWGWYGERIPVRTREEAIRILSVYFSSVEGVKISIVKERRWFFEAEIRDNKDRLVDVVILDKRAGRIRSIY